MAELTVTPGDVAPVKVIEQHEGKSGEAFNAGEAVRLDTTTGKLVAANGTTAAEARCIGIALTTANGANVAVTVLRKGIVDLGGALDALTYDDDVFLSDTDGTLGDTAGTVSLIVGTVVPGFASTTPDRLLRVDL